MPEASPSEGEPLPTIIKNVGDSDQVHSLSLPSPRSPVDAASGHPVFDVDFRDSLNALFSWRRDVRHFDPAPFDDNLVEQLLDAACLAPSVGNAQPWRFVSVDDPVNRAAVTDNFARANAEALAGYSGERARLYANLKLSGLRDAPRHFAVFCDETTSQGKGLGRKTMPETLRYSVVMAVHTFWLTARAHGIGVGWVSILDPAAVTEQLQVTAGWSLVAYLCVGRPLEQSQTPELERRGWQSRTAVCRQMLQR
jgi:5,6-dimethylbenzimidazole synthase